MKNQNFEPSTRKMIEPRQRLFHMIPEIRNQDKKATPFNMSRDKFERRPGLGSMLGDRLLQGVNDTG